MSNVERMLDGLVESYQGPEEINNLETHRLPNRRAVIEGFEHVQHLIFLGYFSTRCITDETLRDVLREHLEQARGVWVEQVIRATQWQDRGLPADRRRGEGWCTGVVDDLLLELPRLRRLLGNNHQHLSTETLDFLEKLATPDQATEFYEDLIQTLTHPQALELVTQRTQKPEKIEARLRVDPTIVDSWITRLQHNPDDTDALRYVTLGLFAHGRHTECYSLLANIGHQAQLPEQRTQILLKLAEIAVNYLDAPEEALEHLNEALEISGPSPHVLAGFADLHMANNAPAEALDIIETLLHHPLAPEERIEWLHVGLEAAEQAGREDARTHFFDLLNSQN